MKSTDKGPRRRWVDNVVMDLKEIGVATMNLGLFGA